jgi:hypothetical protein
MGMHREASESDQVDDDQRQRPETMCHGAENRCVRHERSGLHVTERYRNAISHRTNFLRSTPSSSPAALDLFMWLSYRCFTAPGQRACAALR